MMLPDLTQRSREDELMDDFSITDARLDDALQNIAHVNRFLSGWRTTQRVLVPYLRRHKGKSLRMLDLGTGIADHPARWVPLAASMGVRLEVVAVDANAVSLAHADRYLTQALPPEQRACIQLETADAMNLPYAPDSFDVVHAALFLHHFDDAEAAQLLASMQRLAHHGIIVNDLHRHALAYMGIKALTYVFPGDQMFANDAPLSVMRAFTREELRHLAAKADLLDATIRWHWAFRWSLSTLRT